MTSTLSRRSPAAIRSAAGVLLFLLLFRPNPVVLPELAGLEPGLDAASQAVLEDPALAADLEMHVSPAGYVDR